MAPHLPFHIIGIRPGEKLHETMVPEVDSGSTYDLGDRYIIESPLDLPIKPLKERFPDLVKLVPKKFTYSSDLNTEWLDMEELRQILEVKGMLPEIPQ